MSRERGSILDHCVPSGPFDACGEKNRYREEAIVKASLNSIRFTSVMHTALDLFVTAMIFLTLPPLIDAVEKLSLLAFVDTLHNQEPLSGNTARLKLDTGYM